MKSKLVILVELSYKDEKILRHLVNFLLSKFNLHYYDSVSRWNSGSVGIFVGRYTASEANSILGIILNYLDKYRPFIQFLALNYDRFWLTRSKIHVLVGKSLTVNHKLNLPVTGVLQVNSLITLLPRNIINIIYLLKRNETRT